ncbi:MAG: hypothetical protein QXL34_06895 [Thermosphaera sp.]
MPTYTRLEVLNEIIKVGLVPLFYNQELEIAELVLNSCMIAKAKVVEYINRGNSALDVFKALNRLIEQKNYDVILGAGTIDDPFTASLFIQAGANFIVSPSLNIETARLCNRYKIAYIPGCFTISEIALAEEYGVEICKLFPANQTFGPDFIKAINGPRPWSRIMPTGGIPFEQNAIKKWIRAGAVAVGMGSSLISQEVIQGRKFKELSENIRQIVQWIREERTNSQ